MHCTKHLSPPATLLRSLARGKTLHTEPLSTTTIGLPQKLHPSRCALHYHLCSGILTPAPSFVQDAAASSMLDGQPPLPPPPPPQQHNLVGSKSSCPAPSSAASPKAPHNSSSPGSRGATAGSETAVSPAAHLVASSSGRGRSGAGLHESSYPWHTGRLPKEGSIMGAWLEDQVAASAEVCVHFIVYVRAYMHIVYVRLCVYVCAYMHACEHLCLFVEVWSL